jgi:transposase
MTPIELCNSVRTLQAQGHPLREISRLLRLSRNTVRRILREQTAPVARAGALDQAMQQRLKEVYERAKGNAVRMGQILAAEYDQWLAYSTLTRWVRQAELRRPPKRSGEYHFAPGQEMQHDTSPHRVEIAGKTVTAQCEGLTLAYSRRLFIQPKSVSYPVAGVAISMGEGGPTPTIRSQM